MQIYFTRTIFKEEPFNTIKEGNTTFYGYDLQFSEQKAEKELQLAQYIREFILTNGEGIPTIESQSFITLIQEEFNWELTLDTRVNILLYSNDISYDANMYKRYYPTMVVDGTIFSCISMSASAWYNVLIGTKAETFVTKNGNKISYYKTLLIDSPETITYDFNSTINLMELLHGTTIDIMGKQHFLLLTPLCLEANTNTVWYEYNYDLYEQRLNNNTLNDIILIGAKETLLRRLISPKSVSYTVDNYNIKVYYDHGKCFTIVGSNMLNLYTHKSNHDDSHKALISLIAVNVYDKETFNKTFGQNQIATLRRQLTVLKDEYQANEESIIIETGKLATFIKANNLISKNIIRINNELANPDKEVDDIYGFLEQQEDLISFSYDNGNLVFITKPLVSRNPITKLYHCVGQYKVNVRLTSNSFYATNLIGRHLDGRNGLHLFSNGNPCLGNGAQTFATLCAEKDIREIFFFIMSFLTTPNVSDYYGAAIHVMPLLPSQQLSNEEIMLWHKHYKTYAEFRWIVDNNNDLAEIYECENYIGELYPWSLSQWNTTNQKVKEIIGAN